MRGWWQEISGLVLPTGCAGCGRERTMLCGACRAVLHRRAAWRARPSPAPPGLPEVYAALPYEDEVRALLLAHKERGALRLAEPLGAALATAVRALCEAEPGAPVGGGFGRWAPGRRTDGGVRGGWPIGTTGGGPVPLVLVPVPSARRSVAVRGQDPARRLALGAADTLRRGGLPARVLPVLRQRRAVRDQVGLGARQRWENLAGALALAGGTGRLLGAGPVVLVDDLMTTGASLAEASRVVSSVVGVRVVGAAVVAAPLVACERNRNGTGSVDRSTSKEAGRLSR